MTSAKTPTNKEQEFLATLTPEELDWYEERSAIIEHEGEVPKQMAETQALRRTWLRRKRKKLLTNLANRHKMRTQLTSKRRQKVDRKTKPTSALSAQARANCRRHVLWHPPNKGPLH